MYIILISNLNNMDGRRNRNKIKRNGLFGENITFKVVTTV